MIWGASKLSSSVHKLQKRAIGTIIHKSYNYHTDPLFKGCGILKLSDQYIHDVAVFVHTFKYGKLPKSFDSLTYFVQRNQPQLARQIMHIAHDIAPHTLPLCHCIGCQGYGMTSVMIYEV